MTNELTPAVLALVADELGVEPGRLTLETRLLHDLGCDGDDAADLLERFAVAFGVDVNGFQLERHFGPEGSFNPLVYLYLRLFRRDKLRAVPLTVGDLVDAARTKRLRGPERAAV